MCAFELLASLAGQLLQESESSACSNASEGNHQPTIDRQDEVKPSIIEGSRRGSFAESIFTDKKASQNSDQKPLLHAKTDSSLEHISVSNSISSNHLKKTEADVKSETFKWDSKIKNGFGREHETGVSDYHGSISADKCDLKEQLELYMSPAVIDSKTNVKYPLHRKPSPIASFSKHGNGIKLAYRDDDDENFLRCTKVSTKSRAFRSPRRIAHRRIKNLLSSKYWKVAPKLKECELSRSGKLA